MWAVIPASNLWIYLDGRQDIDMSLLLLKEYSEKNSTECIQSLLAQYSQQKE